MPHLRTQARLGRRLSELGIVGAAVDGRGARLEKLHRPRARALVAKDPAIIVAAAGPKLVLLYERHFWLQLVVGARGGN